MFWFLLGAGIALLGIIGEKLSKDKENDVYDPSFLPPSVRGDNTHNAEGQHYTQDDIIYKDGQYYENENSEDWEEFEYEISEDERFK